MVEFQCRIVEMFVNGVDFSKFPSTEMLHRCGVCLLTKKQFYFRLTGDNTITLGISRKTHLNFQSKQFLCVSTAVHFQLNNRKFD